MTQPTALELIAEHENNEWSAGTIQWRNDAVAELRRLHAENEELNRAAVIGGKALRAVTGEVERLHAVNAQLVEVLEDCIGYVNPRHHAQTYRAAHAALAAAKEQA